MKSRHFASALELLFNPAALIPFLIGTLCVAILGSAVYQAITNVFGTSTNAVLGIALVTLLVLLVCARVLGMLLARVRPLPALVDKKPPPKCRGLILLVSNEATCRKAIEWHKERLERCWLICSTDTAPTARKLAEELRSNRLTVPPEIPIADVHNPLEYRDRVNDIYARLPEGWSDRDIIADYTGMTASASVGMIFACMTEERPIQYIPAYYDKDLKALQPLDPIEVMLHWGLVGTPPSSGR